MGHFKVDTEFPADTLDIEQHEITSSLLCSIAWQRGRDLSKDVKQQIKKRLFFDLRCEI